MKKVAEAFTPEDTFRLGFQMAEKAAPGDVIALLGDLGVGKTVFTKGFAAGLAYRKTSVVRHLPSCSFMRRDGCRCIILMYIESATRRK